MVGIAVYSGAVVVFDIVCSLFCFFDVFPLCVVVVFVVERRVPCWKFGTTGMALASGAARAMAQRAPYAIQIPVHITWSSALGWLVRQLECQHHQLCSHLVVAAAEGCSTHPAAPAGDHVDPSASLPYSYAEYLINIFLNSVHGISGVRKAPQPSYISLTQRRFLPTSWRLSGAGLLVGEST